MLTAASLGGCSGGVAGSAQVANAGRNGLDAVDTASPPAVMPAPPPTAAAPTTGSPSTTPTTSTTSTTITTSTTSTTTTTTATPSTTTTTLPSPAIVPIAAPTAPFAAVGDHGGDETARIQQRLLDLGFWLGGADGSYDLSTAQAVMAFQKYSGLEASGRVDQATADALSNGRLRGHGAADAGTLVEIDKDRQLLFVIGDGRTVWIFNTSTGDGEPYEEPDRNSPGETARGVSITPSGLHRVDRERAEGWWDGDLGQIYRPKYFVGGVAVHGSNHVPNYPASHGCVRVTTVAMDFIWDTNLMPIGIPVWVHGA